MRDYTYTPSACWGNPVKVVFIDTLPVFSASDLIDDNAITGWTSYDADEYNDSIVRVAVLGGFIHYQIVTALLAYLNDHNRQPPWDTDRTVEVKGRF